MRIMAVFSPDAADVLRVWERSWRLRGWFPGVLSPKTVQEEGSPKKAAKARGAQLVISPRAINYNFKRPRKYPKRFPVIKYGDNGWQVAPIVMFPEWMSDVEILRVRSIY